MTPLRRTSCFGWLATSATAVLLGGCTSLPIDSSLVGAEVRVSGVTTNLHFAYRQLAPEQPFDQLLTIDNPGPAGMAPTLEFTALDAAGKPLADVAVKTVYGTDRGIFVVPARSSASEMLRFPGSMDRPVAGIAVRVKAVDEFPEATVRTLPRFYRIDDGRAYRVIIRGDAPVTVRVVLTGFNRQGIGGARQFQPLSFGPCPHRDPGPAQTQPGG